MRPIRRMSVLKREDKTILFRDWSETGGCVGSNVLRHGASPVMHYADSLATMPEGRFDFRRSCGFTLIRDGVDGPEARFNRVFQRVDQRNRPNRLGSQRPSAVGQFDE